MPAKFIAVANRRGGVGKTTLTMMLAYGLAAVQGKRVLVVDLDSQASTTSVFIDAERWAQHRRNGRTIGNYLATMVSGQPTDQTQFIAQCVGSLVQRPHFFARAMSIQTNIDLVPSSSDLEDIETSLIISQAHQHPDLSSLFATLQEGTRTLVRNFEPGYDIVLLDCPPGLSYLVWGALKGNNILDSVVVKP